LVGVVNVTVVEDGAPPEDCQPSDCDEPLVELDNSELDWPGVLSRLPAAGWPPPPPPLVLVLMVVVNICWLGLVLLAVQVLGD
jgi:hypothetical protein